MRRHYLSVTSSSVRRSCARPSAVAFDATGLVSPKPRAVRRDAGMPHLTSQSRTALARRRERPMLYSSEPMLSVYPSHDTSMDGSALSVLQASSRIGSASGRMLYLSKSKLTPRSTIFFFVGGVGAGAAAATGAAGAGGGAGGDCCKVNATPVVTYCTLPNPCTSRLYQS